MKAFAISLAIMLAGCGPGGSLVGAAPPEGVASGPAQQLHRAAQLANGALADLYRYDTQLQAAAGTVRQQLVLDQEQKARAAVQAAFDLVADATRTSPPAYLDAYRTLKDALDSGRLAPSPEARIAYYRDALGKIGALASG